MGADTIRLAVALADAAGRFAAAQRLAGCVGADALVILIEDPEVRAFLPASGFSTLPGGAGWRDLLALVRSPGLHRGVVSFPTPEATAHALAYAASGVALVFIGGTPDTAIIDELGPIAPLIASTLRAEQDAIAARGNQRVALNHAREAAALAAALDAARSQLEGALRTLEERSRALDRARERAEAAVRAKDDFLAMLGHELRNPLSPIMTALQLLRLKGHSGREHEIIERQVKNLVRLVEDLLDVSRLTAGKIALRTEPVEVADVVTRAIEMVSPMLEHKRQLLSLEIPPLGLIVDADPIRLAQVFANLVTNAAKYSDDGTRITLRAIKDEGRVRVSVTDQGIGISREMLDRVFDLFEQQRQAIDRSQGGLGLGLAIARSLVTLHGGTVRAASHGIGCGAEFVVELPLAAQVRAPLPRHRAARAAIGSAGPARRVLVVDDNPDALILLSDALSAVGYQVQPANDGPGALAVAAAFQPQIAVLDIGLPVMDGYELATRLRVIAGLGALRLVAVTGYGQESDRRRSGLAGFDAHLIKPVPLDELVRVLSDLSPEPANDAGNDRNHDL
jgi:signal transduction histidine kinase/CheY-like chemotaxis protein